MCVIWLDRKYCRWTCAMATLYINIYLHRECGKTSFIHCLIETAENLIWPVVFLFFCSWWLTEEQYLFAALNLHNFLSHSGIYFRCYFSIELLTWYIQSSMRMGPVIRTSHRCWKHRGLHSPHWGRLFKIWWMGGGGGGESIHTGSMRGAYNSIEKYLWTSSSVSKVVPAISLQA